MSSLDQDGEEGEDPQDLLDKKAYLVPRWARETERHGAAAQSTLLGVAGKSPRCTACPGLWGLGISRSSSFDAVVIYHGLRTPSDSRNIVGIE